MKFALALVVAVASMVKADDKGGFAASCKHLALVEHNNHTGLRAECQATGNTTQCSILDLNECYMYKRTTGNIEASDEGGFNHISDVKTCALDGFTMSCQILRDTYKRREVWLNRTISNDGGYLRCFANRADAPLDCATRPAFSDSDRPSEALVLLPTFGPTSAFVVFLFALVWYK
ncbi:hypothetical protein GGR54DRAFT_648628 [Hypoxylon sp. NC1633]|nr:hypothetical protein GGR54DRAFT_648628 [Hypoxylon sp. NC1633]